MVKTIADGVFQCALCFNNQDCEMSKDLSSIKNQDVFFKLWCGCMESRSCFLTQFYSTVSAQVCSWNFTEIGKVECKNVRHRSNTNSFTSPIYSNVGTVNQLVNHGDRFKILHNKFQDLDTKTWERFCGGPCNHDSLVLGPESAKPSFEAKFACDSEDKCTAFNTNIENLMENKEIKANLAFPQKSWTIQDKLIYTVRVIYHIAMGIVCNISLLFAKMCCIISDSNYDKLKTMHVGNRIAELIMQWNGLPYDYSRPQTIENQLFNMITART